VTCPEERIVAFLAGDLSGEEERSFDEHLLTCEECWQAVQTDRAARLALGRLRVPAPAGLTDRVALGVLVAAGAPAAPRGRPGPERLAARLRSLLGHPNPVGVAAAVLLIALAATGGGWLLARGPASTDPPQVAAVVAMIKPHTAPSPALRAGEHLMIARQPVMVRAYELKGEEALVATSARPFPVPKSSHLLSGSSSKAWMATKGHLSMYGVNRPAGEQSMFLVAAMPMAELPQVAANLHLI